MYNAKHNNRLQGCMMGNRESLFYRILFCITLRTIP